MAGGSEAVNYTVQAGDTLTSIATNMASAINADTALQATAVTATSSGTVLNIKSASANATTYTKSTSGGATETVALAPSTSATQYGYNNLNEMTSIAAGGATKWQGTTNKALKLATVNSNTATLNSTQSFAGNATLANGVNSIPMAVTDGSNATKNNSYQVSSNGSMSATPTYDLNGNMTSDGMNSFLWDAENQLVLITYAGVGNHTKFSYDSVGQTVFIAETLSNVISSQKQLVWCEEDVPLEERDSTSAPLSQCYQFGQRTQLVDHFMLQNHQGSVVQTTLTSGALASMVEYDSFGNRTGDLLNFQVQRQFQGMYLHSASGLSLTRFRQYSPRIGRWLKRDILEEGVSPNLFEFGFNSPANFTDPTGLNPPLTYSVPTATAMAAPFITTTTTLVGGALATTAGNVAGSTVIRAGLAVGSLGTTAQIAIVKTQAALVPAIASGAVAAAAAAYPAYTAMAAQWHHIWPQYLGGPLNGPVVLLPAPYHRMITTQFQNRFAYRQPIPLSCDAQKWMRQVYNQLPIVGFPFKSVGP